MSIKIKYLDSLLFLFILSLISCTSNDTSDNKTSMSESQTHIFEDYPQAEALRTTFFSKPFHYIIHGSLATVNSSHSNYYDNMVPKATIFADYNSGNKRKIFLSVNFSWPFEKNLPPEILAELAKRKLLNSQSVDIAWVVQFLPYIGGNTDNAVKNITYLKAHGWADQDAPADYSGTRIKRDFLYALYDSDKDISYQVKNALLLPFELHTHDAMYSPKTAAIKLPSDAPESMALWSLVIDNKNPKKKIRAIATLHWLIAQKDVAHLLEESVHDHTIRGQHYQGDIKFAMLGDFINILRTSSFLKDSSLVKKLESLIRP